MTTGSEEMTAWEARDRHQEPGADVLTDCGETVRRVAHRVNCHLKWPEFRVEDFEVNTSPKSERRRGQEHGCKAGVA